jgi:type II secretory pathway pseudopilin PulG
MKFKLPTLPRCADRRATRRAGFTLAEVLAALAFMSIVIPVTVQGIRIASQAGQVGERRAVAARVADRLMNELLVTGQVSQGVADGLLQEGTRTFNWNLTTQPWTQDNMTLVTLRVAFDVQGQEYDVTLNTLVDETQNSTTSSSSAASSSTTP